MRYVLSFLVMLGLLCPELAHPQNPPEAQSPPAGQLLLTGGTPISMRLNREVSSADAHVGDFVEFEVTQDVVVNGVVVIPKGSTAQGKVTEAVPKRRMGRAGKLEIVLDYVRLGDNEKASIRAVKDAKGKSRTTGMTVGIVATGLLFWPAAPLFLLMHGKDITVPKGAEVTGYINDDMHLDAARFVARPDAASSANASQPEQTQQEVKKPESPGTPQ